MSVTIMKDPVAYNNHNKLQHRDNLNFLLDNINRIQWKRGDRILDIGSGDGSCTSKILKRFLPDDYQELIGIDKSEEMVRHANQYYGEERVKFEVVDVCNDSGDEFLGGFDHAFSFFTIQWIHDQKKAFGHIYDMLSPGADCLFLILCDNSTFYDMYRYFAASKKWGTWFKNVEQIVSPYHRCQNVEEKVTKIMSDTGFKDIHIQYVDTSYKYDSIEDFKLAIRAVNSFAIPEELFDEYLNEHIQVAMKRGYIDEDVIMRYKLLYIYGRK